MTDVHLRGMVLPPDELNSLDEWILDFLAAHDWATPNLLRLRYNEARDEEEQVSRQWVATRIKRLREHKHIQYVHPDTSLYQLVTDPRQDGVDAEGEEVVDENGGESG